MNPPLETLAHHPPPPPPSSRAADHPPPPPASKSCEARRTSIPPALSLRSRWWRLHDPCLAPVEGRSWNNCRRRLSYVSGDGKEAGQPFSRSSQNSFSIGGWDVVVPAYAAAVPAFVRPLHPLIQPQDPIQILWLRHQVPVTPSSFPTASCEATPLPLLFSPYWS
jgi:hypothetical protein